MILNFISEKASGAVSRMEMTLSLSNGASEDCAVKTSANTDNEETTHTQTTLFRFENE